MRQMRLGIAAAMIAAIGLLAPSAARAQDGGPTSRRAPRCQQCGHALVGVSLSTDPVLRARMHGSNCTLARNPAPAGATPSPQGTPSGQSGEPGGGGAGGGGTPGAPGTGTGTGAGAGAGAAGTSAADGPVNLGGNQGLRGAEPDAPVVFGDLSPLQAVGQLPGGPPRGAPLPGPVPNPGNGTRSAAPPGFVRGFKIADNQSVRPVNRFYYDFNFFDNVWQKVNERNQNGINRVQIYRQLLGFEKTFLDGNASFGVRLPINTITADGAAGGQPTPTSTAVNSFSVYTKFLFYTDTVNKVYASWGVAGTIPTGPRNFGGAKYVQNYNNPELQPYVGYQKSWKNLYLLGFEAINIPLNTHDVTTIYNDIALGYYVYRAPNKTNFIQAIAPAFETHINIPLNHRDVYNIRDRAGTSDIVDLTYGLNTYFRGKTLLGIGAVMPVTGPRPFSLEAMAFLNVFF